MLNSHYFTVQLRDQMRSIEGSCAVEIHLYSGKMFRVNDFDAAEDGYLLLKIYVDEPRDPSAVIDYAAIPYEAISHVVVTKRELSKPAKLGFLNTEVK